MMGGMRISSLLARAWASPGVNSLAATAMRAIAFLVPVPFLSRVFDPPVIALWLLIVTLQSLTALAIGNLPTILMHMVSHARVARSRGLTNAAIDLPSIVHAIRRIFSAASLFYILLALAVFTPLLWRQISLIEDPTAAIGAWSFFIVGTVLRIRTLAFTTYLLGLNEVTKVRRMEAWSWSVGALASSAGLLAWPNLAIAMFLLQAPVALLLIVMYRLAKAHGWQTLLSEKIDPRFSIRRDIFPRAAKGSIGIVVAYLTFYVGSLIYAQFGGSQEIASFSFTLAVFGLISQLAVANTMASLPSMSYAYAGAEWGRLHSLAAKAGAIEIVLYLGLIFAAWISCHLLEVAAPDAFPQIDPALFALFALAYLPVRYASFHLHLYTITNDIKWHHYQLGVAAIYFPMIYLLGLAWLPSYPLALLVANLCFAAPFARRLTYTRLGFGFTDERLTIAILVMAVIATTLLGYRMGLA